MVFSCHSRGYNFFFPETSNSLLLPSSLHMFLTHQSRVLQLILVSKGRNHRCSTALCLPVSPYDCQINSFLVLSFRTPPCAMLLKCYFFVVLRFFTALRFHGGAMSCGSCRMKIEACTRKRTQV